MNNLNLFPSSNITEINCGTSSPRLSGTIDLSIFLNLTNFTCANNDIVNIIGYENNPNLINIQFNNNNVTGFIPSLGANTQLQVFRCNGNLLTGSIPSFNLNTEITSIRVEFQRGLIRLTGSIPDLSNNTKLTLFYCNNNQLTGTIPDLVNNTQLEQFFCDFNQLSIFNGNVPNTLGTFRGQTNQLSTTAINAILSAFVAANKTTGTRILNLGGTGNAAPTGQGITDKSILQSRGWTVTTN